MKQVSDVEYQFDEQTGEEIEVEVKETRHIKQSKTDPECGLFHKGEKEKLVLCQEKGWACGQILGLL